MYINEGIAQCEIFRAACAVPSGFIYCLFLFFQVVRLMRAENVIMTTTKWPTPACSPSYDVLNKIAVSQERNVQFQQFLHQN